MFSRCLPSYAQDHGWTPQRSWDGTITYTGYFRITGLRWEGRVTQQRNGSLHFEINNPPIAYIRDSEWAGCFHALQGKWMWVTFKRQPPDIDSGIAAINKILKSVYEHRRPTARRFPWR